MTGNTSHHSQTSSSVLFFLIFCITAFASSPALARSTRVYGTVQDAAGRGVPLALVRFIAGADTAAAFTDSTGTYSVNLTMESVSVTEEKPVEFSLEQNYPNPFNPSTVIGYTLPAPANVRLDIYSISGQKIRTLVNGYEDAGRKTVQWDGRDRRGKGAAAGVYLYRLQAEKFTQTRKMLVLDGHSGSIAAKPATTTSNTEQITLSFTMEVKKEGFRSWRESCRISSDTSAFEKNVSLVSQYLRISRYPTRNYRVTAGNALSVQIFGISAPPLNETPELILVSTVGDSERIKLKTKYYRYEEVMGVEPYLTLSDDPTSGPLLLIGYFPTADSTAIPGDGVLQVNSAADTISVEYYSTADGDTIRGTLTVQKYRQEIVRDIVYEYVNRCWIILIDNDRWCPMAQNELFVRFIEGTSQDVIDSLNTRVGATIRQIFSFDDFHYISYLLQIPDGADLMDIMKTYAAEEIVQSVGPDANGTVCRIN